jgi:membrane-associated phospholipid phosphatase
MIDFRAPSFLFLCATLNLVSVSTAASAAAEVTSYYFTTNLNLDLPIIAVSSAIWAVPSAMDRSRNLDLCLPYCDPDSINPWDRRVVPHHNENAKIASDVLVVALPAQALWLVLLDSQRLGAKAGVSDVIILAEVLGVQAAVNQIVKTAVKRPRPYMYREESLDGLRKNNADDYRSFYSSHTSTVFAVLTGASTIVSLRYPHSGLKWLMWTVAMAGGASVAMLRTLAGKHFYTDVLIGGIAGIGVGVAVPLLHCKRQKSNRKVTLHPSGLGLAGTF